MIRKSSHDKNIFLTAAHELEIISDCTDPSLIFADNFNFTFRYQFQLISIDIQYSLLDVVQCDNSINHLIPQCISLLLFLIGIQNKLVECQRKVSPCPTVFTYDQEKDTSDTWHGTLKLQSSVPLHGVTVDVIFDRRAATFGAYYFNDVSTTDYTEYRVENKNFKLNPGRTLVMNVYVRYENSIPLLKQIRMNGQNICIDLPSPVIQPIYTSNSNSNSNSESESNTRRTTRRENPNYG
jgi:Serine protease gd N-terminus